MIPELSSHNLSVLIYLSASSYQTYIHSCVTNIPGLTGRVYADIQNHKGSHGSGLYVPVNTKSVESCVSQVAEAHVRDKIIFTRDSSYARLAQYIDVKLLLLGQ